MLALAVPPSLPAALLFLSLSAAPLAYWLLRKQTLFFGCHVTICGRSWRTRSCEVTLPLSWFLFRVNSLLRSLSSTFICFNFLFWDFLFSSFIFGTVFCQWRELNLLSFLPFSFYLCFTFVYITLLLLFFRCSYGLLLLLLFALHTLTFHGYRFVDCNFFLLFASFLLCFTGTDIHTWAFRLSFFCT